VLGVNQYVFGPSKADFALQILSFWVLNQICENYQTYNQVEFTHDIETSQASVDYRHEFIFRLNFVIQAPLNKLLHHMMQLCPSQF
jgi:hypothetical protein